MTKDPGRWHQLLQPDGLGLSFKITNKDGQLVVSDVYLQRDGGLRASDLDAVKLDRWQAAAAQRAALERASAQLTSGQAEPSIPEMRDAWRAARSRGSALELPRDVRPPAVPEVQADRPRLKRPDKSGSSEFYDLVATAYREYAAAGRAPATKMAEEAGVPVTTVHRWVREARRRNLLPPARPGVTTA